LIISTSTLASSASFSSSIFVIFEDCFEDPNDQLNSVDWREKEGVNHGVGVADNHINLINNRIEECLKVVHVDD